MMAKKTKTDFKSHVKDWADKLDVTVLSITVRPMETKWASFSTSGRLTFDTTVLGLPSDLQDYIIVHELLHFHVPNHGRLWKSLMRVHLGDYEKQDRRLRKIARDRSI